MKKHLAIFNPQAIAQIFKGKKTIETRFSMRRIAPFGLISRGDLVYIKPPGQEIVGQFTGKKVIFFEGLEQKDWEFIKKEYGQKMSFGSKKEDQKFFKSKQKAQFGTLIFIDKIEQFITSPIKVSKKDLRGWVVL